MKPYLQTMDKCLTVAEAGASTAKSRKAFEGKREYQMNAEGSEASSIKIGQLGEK